jgi:NDP-sugar pyrophosphorylase family protein
MIGSGCFTGLVWEAYTHRMLERTDDQFKQINTALVLAGGRGERLRPLTDDVPKPMVHVRGTPIIEHHLRWLCNQGIRRAVLLTGYKHEIIQDYFSTHRIDGLLVECVYEEEPLGRGGAIRNGFNVAGIMDDLFVVTNGDIITNQELSPLYHMHQDMNVLVTILVTHMVSPFGIVDISEEDTVVGFSEKPQLPYWVNAGTYIVSSELINEFPLKGDHETTLFPQLAKSGRIAAFKSRAYWRSVESAKDLVDIEAYLGKTDQFKGVF